MDVPVNVAVAVVLYGRTSVATNVAVNDLTASAALQVDVADHGTWLGVSATYEASHEYEVIVTGADFSVRTTFQTGVASDVTPPAFSGLGTAAFETMKWPVVQPDGGACGGSCDRTSGGRLSRVILGYSPPPSDTQLLTLQLVHNSVHEEFLIPRPWTNNIVGFDGCNRVPVLEVGARYCARLVAYDVAGNMSGDTAEICADTVDCHPELEPGIDCRPSQVCTPETVEPPPDDTEGCNATMGRSNGLLQALLVLIAILFGRRRRESVSSPGVDSAKH